jgi:hypothetical protein
MIGPRIHLLEDLGAEFERVSRDHERRPRRRLASLRCRTPLLVWLLCLVLASGALAVLDVPPIGTKLLAEDVTGTGEPEYRSPRTVVATGESAGQEWFMTVTQSDQGRCVGLWLDTKLGRDGTDTCGGPESFDAVSVGGGDVLPRTTLVFGPAPEKAARVRVMAPDGFSRTAPTHDGPSDIEGNTYLIQIPRKGVRNALINWLDRNGHAERPSIYVPSTVVYGKRPAGPPRPH